MQITYNPNRFCIFCHKNTYSKKKITCSDAICKNKRRNQQHRAKKTDGGTVDMRRFCIFCHKDVNFNRSINGKRLTCYDFKCIKTRRRIESRNKRIADKHARQNALVVNALSD